MMIVERMMTIKIDFLSIKLFRRNDDKNFSLFNEQIYGFEPSLRQITVECFAGVEWNGKKLLCRR